MGANYTHITDRNMTFVTLKNDVQRVLTAKKAQPKSRNWVSCYFAVKKSAH
jgi:hypothetical protein